MLKPYQAGESTELLKKLQEKMFTLKQLGISHRKLIVWDEKGLLHSSTEKGKWRRFSFFEWVWIKIISNLRDYNIPIQTILELKDKILFPLSLAEAAMTPEVIDSVIEMAPPEHKALARKIMSDKELIKKELGSESMPYLLLFIMDVILLKSHFAFLVNLDGDFIPFKEFYIEEFQKLPGFTEFIHKSHVSISLSDIVTEFLVGEDLELTQHRLAILTENEAQIIHMIRTENLSSLKIRFKGDREVDLIETTQDQKLDKESRFYDLITRSGYQEIILKTEKGKIVQCLNTHKHKLQQ